MEAQFLTMFRGNLPAKIDAQGRIKIPTGHRRIFKKLHGPELYVTSISGKNVRIYPLQEWEKIESKLSELPKMLPGKARFLRNTSFYGQVSKMDRQGRVLVQALLRQEAQLEQQEVAVIGQLNYLEVWNQQRFKKVLETDPYTDEDAQALAQLGL